VLSYLHSASLAENMLCPAAFYVLHNRFLLTGEASICIYGWGKVLDYNFPDIQSCPGDPAKR